MPVRHGVAMDLRALRYFELIGELKSFSRAAVHLRVAQPALSRQVKKLERELAVQLVRRTGHGIELTDAGRLLLQRTRQLSREVADLVQEVRARGDELRGTMVVGAPPTIGDLMMPSLVVEAGRAYPDLTLAVIEGASPDLYHRVLDKELSLCLLHNPEPHRDLVILPVLVDYLYVIGPGRVVNGLRPVVAGQPITDLPMILPRPPHNRRLLIDKFCIAHGIELNVARAVDGFTIIRAMVEAGLGYSILSYYGVREGLIAGRLSATMVTHPEMPWELCLAFRRDFKPRRAILALVRLIGQRVKDLADEGEWWPNAAVVPIGPGAGDRDHDPWPPG